MMRRAILLLATLTPAICSAEQPAPPIVVERVVPPGATLTYAVDGQTVSVLNVPPGRVRVTIELGDVRARSSARVPHGPRRQERME
jgi:hypothetical protein